MKVILLKDHQLGKAGDEVEVSQEQGNYLVRMGVANIWIESTSASISAELEKEEMIHTKEKKEFTPAREKVTHTSMPTGKGKKGRPPTKH